FRTRTGRGEGHVHVGKDRSGAGAEGGVRTITPATLKPPPDRLYGRERGHKLRARQQRLLDVTLPRLPLPQPAVAEQALRAALPPGPLWLEVGFGGGEHALAQIRENPE